VTLLPQDSETDVLVIGAGAAGLMAACTAARDRETILVTDRALGACNSSMAQGGLQLPLPDDDARERFIDDILRSARVPVDEMLVREFAGSVGECVSDLEAWGLELDRDAGGQLVRKYAGGLSDPRIVTCGDAIGPALMRVLRRRVETLDIPVVTHARVVALRPDDGHFTVEIREPDGGTRCMRASSVVAATGGLTFSVAAQRHEPTTNPKNENHVLYDVIRHMGIQRVHEEYFQYQPFGIVSLETDAIGRCVPESIVNFAVRLLDRRGEAVIDVRRDRLAVSTAMREAIANDDCCTTATGRKGLVLTLSDVPTEDLREAFPRLAALLERERALGDDVLVQPFLHYQLGGFRTDLNGATAIPGLFLAGEMTGGLHGMNRLMGNGITDALVRGRLAGRAAGR
jgi:aspartate oxidase